MGWKYWNPYAVSKGIERVITARIVLGTNTNVGFVASPYAGVIKSLTSVVDTLTDTADELVGAAVSGGTTMGNITVADASAAGVVDTLVPTANNVIAVGGTIDLTTNGANGVASVLNVTIVIDEVVQ